MKRTSSLPGIGLALLLAACGSSYGQAGWVQLTVLAASSLSNVMPAIGRAFTSADAGPAVRFTFGGTDMLAVALEQGARADLFAGASEQYGDRLLSAGLVEPPHPFTTNRLVLVVPPSNPAHISSLLDLSTPGIRLVVGAPTVPVGLYTRRVVMGLGRSLGAAYPSKVLANVVSNATNAEGVLTAVVTGEADAGFVYVTDAKAAGPRVHTIMLPAQAQAVATYPIAVIRSTPYPQQAGAFVRFVLGSQAQALLRAAGFGAPPPS